VVIWDDKQSQATFTLEFRTAVLSVRLSRTRVVVTLQNSVHIYTFATPPSKLSVYETADNYSGICCLGTKIIAFPGPRSGQVQVVEMATGNVSIIPAHEAPLQALCLSPDGEVLATASETGTLIRIFATSNCARIAELRRGVDHATISSIAISPSSTLLAVTSDKATLHVFDLPNPFRPSSAHSQASRSNSATRSGKRPSSRNSRNSPGPEAEPNKQKWGILSKIPLLPRVFSDIYSFASAPISIDDYPDSTGLKSASSYVPIPGIKGGKPKKGLAGWLDDSTVLVVGAGRDGRWEKFAVGEDKDGKRWLGQVGWKRFLGS
jgi:WD40 repeat protein